MATNIFSPLINGEISRFRRVGHSTTNYFSTIGRSSVTVDNAINTGVNLVGVAGGVSGAITLASTVAAGTATAGVMALAFAGPQAAVATAVVGIALLAKGAYSNREAAHKKLSEYVWNLVDNENPKIAINSKATLETAADAAMYLLTEGGNQIKLLGSKHQAALTKFNTLNTTITAKKVQIERDIAREQTHLAPGHMAAGAARQAIAQWKASFKTELEKTWEKETKPGGIIFEYVRRCAHVGNYIQAPHIVAMAMKENVDPGHIAAIAHTDYFANCPIADRSRKSFTDLATIYTAWTTP